MKNVTYTLKAWPMITLVTIGLCYLTQAVAKLFGITLPDQANLELVRRCLGWNWTFAILCAQVLILMPILEELLFRGLLFKLPICKLSKRQLIGEGITWCIGGLSAILFSAAHYLAQPFPDSAFLALFFFGLAQCWLCRKTGSLWCSILNHTLFNLTNLALLFVIPE